MRTKMIKRGMGYRFAYVVSAKKPHASKIKYHKNNCSLQFEKASLLTSEINSNLLFKN